MTVRSSKSKTGVEPLDKRYDVVHVGTHGMPDAWFVNKLDLPVEILNAAGISATQVVPASRRPEVLGDYFVEHPPGAVLLRGLLYAPEAVRQLADRFPDVQWINQVQSSQPFLLQMGNGFCVQQRHIELAKEKRNVWYATADDTPLLSLCACDRAIHVANVFESKPKRHSPRRRPEGRPITVSLISALRDMKNFPNGLIGIAQAGKLLPPGYELAVYLSWTRPQRKDQHPQVVAICETLGLSFEVGPWQPPAEYWKTIEERIDLCLQPTFSESFCYVPLEHMRFGIPAVGTPAVAYLPKTQQANPDDARDIALRIVDTIDNYKARSVNALRCYRGTVERQRDLFVRAIIRVLEA